MERRPSAARIVSPRSSVRRKTSKSSAWSEETLRSSAWRPAHSLLGASHERLDVGHCRRWELEVNKGDIGGVGDDASATERRDARRHLIKPMAQNRRVVRSEIPDDADVRLVQSEIDATRRDRVDLAELARDDELGSRIHRRAEEERVVRHQHGGRRSLHGEGDGVLSGGRKRLLDEYVLSSVESEGSQLVNGFTPRIA